MILVWSIGIPRGPGFMRWWLMELVYPQAISCASGLNKKSAGNPHAERRARRLSHSIQVVVDRRAVSDKSRQRTSAFRGACHDRARQRTRP